MSPKNWGPAMWTFFHTFAIKVKNDAIVPDLLAFIIKICYNLPCPECSTHALEFWSKVKLNTIKTKENLINILFIYHNVVNKLSNKPLISKENLDKYQNENTINVYNNFISVFNTKGNIKLMADNFQRNLIVLNLKNWILKNINYFNP